ncbi:response regulator transcription factor [Blastococcus sp. SYSU D00868]
MSLRVAVADDSVLVRRGVSQVLDSCGLDVVAAVGTAEDLLAVAAADSLDAAVVDIRMPPTHTDEGVRALETLRARGSPVGVLLLSMYVSVPSALRVLAAGRGTGYLLKERVADERALADAVGTVAAGGSVVDPELVAVLSAQRDTLRALDTLTERERDVVRLMAEGRSNRGIATALFVGLKTVETHIAHIMLKLGIDESDDDHRRVLAVLRWLGRPT